MMTGDPPPSADAGAAILTLLAARVLGATICPSDAARALAAAAGDEDWRARMPAVHAAVDGLVAAGEVTLGWRGKAMAMRDCPYRIARRHR